MVIAGGVIGFLCAGHGAFLRNGIARLARRVPGYVLLLDAGDRIPSDGSALERLGVRRLDVFGSATTSAFDEVSSDVDFLVEFEDPSSPSYFDDYFSLKEGLEDILGRPVDLVTRASIENPYFLQRVEATREGLYAA